VFELNLCQALKKDGTPCTAPVAKGQRFCFHHDPERAEKAAEARRSGNEAARKAKTEPARSEGRPPLKKFNLNTLKDVKRLLASVINEFRTGKLTTDEARCLAYVGNVLVGAIKDGEVETRLKELEDRVVAKRGQPWET
jgi:hypothetical protein